MESRLAPEGDAGALTSCLTPPQTLVQDQSPASNSPWQFTPAISREPGGIPLQAETIIAN